MEGGNGVIIYTIQQTMGSNLDDFRLRETIKRTINSSPLVQNANILEKKESAPNGGEESASVTTVDSIGDLGMHEGMSREEIAATQNCIQYEVMLRKGGLSREEKADLEEGFEKAKQVLLAIRRERYDSEGKPFSEKVIRANKVIKNIKTPTYISDEQKRISKFKSMYYGVEDPFYDSFKELYGDEGLLGYKKERLEAFEDIPYRVVNIGGDEMPYRDVVILASQRYKKVNNALTGIKTIAQLGAWIASMIFIFPKSGGNPIIFGAGVALFTELIKLPEMNRSANNYKIFDARKIIGQDLGLLDRDLTQEEVEKKEYEEDDD